MRKTKPFLQTAILTVFAAAILISTGTSAAADRKKPHVTKNNNVTILEYDFAEPQVFAKGDCDVVTVYGFETYIEPGAPRIPVKPVQILIPAGKEIEAIISQAVDTYQLPGTYLLSHGTEQFRKDLGPPKTPTQPNPKIYSMTTFWPAEQHELVTVQSNRGYNIAYVNLFPLQYSPKPGNIKMAAKMRLEIHFAGIDSPRGAKPTKALKKKLKRKLDNPDTMESYDTTPTKSAKRAGPLDSLAGPYQYVVITASSLVDIPDPNFQTLCDSKIVRGISAGVVTTDWILANYDGTRPDGGTDNATKIRNFLIDAYQTWGTEYALLAGDKDIIPGRFLDASGTAISADLYYGCVDPVDCTFDYDADGIYGETNDGVGGSDIDLSADIFVGRAGVESTTEVVNFVRKTLFYESTSDPYLNHALSSGGWLGFGGIQEYSKPWCELVRLGSDLYLGHFACGFESPAIANARDFIVATLYDADDIWNATTDLLPILNGTGGNTTPQLIYCGDHGAPRMGFTKLHTTSTTTINHDCICNLTNTRPFFFYDDSCQVGQFDIEDCFSEEITVGIEYGAFACITLSKSGFGSSGDDLDSVTAMFTREFFHSVLGEGIFELGAALQEARDSLLWRSGMGGFRYAYFEETLFGDPELQLRVTKPVCAHTCGDLDGDGGNVDTDDLDLFNACWQKDIWTYPECICANLVEFGKYTIDILDLAVFNELFLSSSPDYPPNDCSTSITDPYPPSPAPTFETAPYTTGKNSIEMVSTRARDISDVEYYFACTTAGGHDSGWQESQTYEDTGLLPGTSYTYTVKARDLSGNYNETAASAGASATTDLYDNIVLPENGGVLESFTSEYGSGWVASDLTNGITDEDGWASAAYPGPQEFVYSFRYGNSAILHNAEIHGGTAEGWYFSKDVEIWTSADGTSFTLAASDVLDDSPNYSVTIPLGDIEAKKIMLRITSGYESDYWELAEFVVYGAQPDPREPLYTLADDIIDLNLRPGIENSLLAKIEAAIAKLEDGNPKNDKAVINSLQAFINEVEAQRGKKISEDDADDLIAAAQEAIDMLTSG